MFSTENKTLHDMLLTARNDAIADARRLLAHKPVVIDTETTGLDDYAEICEIGIIDHHGDVLLDTRVAPKYGIPDDASRIHGIRDADVAGAPTIGEALDADLVSRLLESTIAIYNNEFDVRLVRQSAAAIGRYDLLDVAMAIYRQTHCVMRLYAKFAGDWSEYHHSYTWHSLSAAAAQCGLEWDGDAHSAIADARMTLGVLQHMAASDDAGVG